VSRQIENLLAAGATVSLDFKAWAAVRYNTPSVCTGQAAGTAAALSIKNRLQPKRLDVALLQSTLRSQGLVTTINQVAAEKMREYEMRAKEALAIEDYAK
jgi:hypothetical protein